jgi:hypothetical protein
VVGAVAAAAAADRLLAGARVVVGEPPLAVGAGAATVVVGELLEGAGAALVGELVAVKAGAAAAVVGELLGVAPVGGGSRAVILLIISARTAI